MISKGWMVAGAMAAVAAASGVGFWSGVAWSDTQWRADVAEEREKATKQGEELRLAQEELAAEREARLQEAERVSLLEDQLASAEAEVIVNEVIKYVQADNTGSCVLPAEWVRIHNQAAGVPATGAATQATSQTDAATATDVTDRDALPVITNNYAHARSCIARLEGLQGWVVELYK